MALLSIENLHLSIPSFEGEARILNGVDLSVERGEICGLVGETGCGKSLTGLSVSSTASDQPPRRSCRNTVFERSRICNAPTKSN
ncbi:MAG: ATP-binding cassette domain-containing protein [Hyphomicrobiales bacterium]|nr:ATP-binding cassette domain-containing protein [Hyphomicrobiales bacterium]